RDRLSQPAVLHPDPSLVRGRALADIHWTLGGPGHPLIAGAAGKQPDAAHPLGPLPDELQRGLHDAGEEVLPVHSSLSSRFFLTLGVRLPSRGYWFPKTSGIKKSSGLFSASAPFSFASDLAASINGVLTAL